VREKKASKQVYKSLGLLMINSFVVRVAIREQKQQQNAHKLAHRKDLIINVYGILKSTEKMLGNHFMKFLQICNAQKTALKISRYIEKIIAIKILHTKNDINSSTVYNRFFRYFRFLEQGVGSKV
jgi:hypothetical protein